VTKAGQNRLFVGKRLAEAKVDLAEAEEALAAFQSRNKAVALDQQAGAALRAAAEIQGRIAADEVRLQVMQNFLTPENPDVIKLSLEIQQLKEQLRMLESGNGGKGRALGDRLHPAFTSVPALGLEYARLMRGLKIQETLHAMLASQYEQAQLAEARDTPTVQVLDRAKPPIRKIRPSIRLNMMVAGAVALLVGVLLAFFLEYLDQVKRRRLGPKVAGLSESVDTIPASEEQALQTVR
jgi:capsule polysaccharide export protein KpsE/RkpR